MNKNWSGLMVMLVIKFKWRLIHHFWAIVIDIMLNAYIGKFGINIKNINKIPIVLWYLIGTKIGRVLTNTN